MSRRLTDGELTMQAAGYHDFGAIELMTIEIRERRQVDDVHALRRARKLFERYVFPRDTNAEAALDKMIAFHTETR